jgi:hypothetical protein
MIPHDGIFYSSKHQCHPIVTVAVTHPSAQHRHFSQEFVAAVEAKVRPFLLVPFIFISSPILNFTCDGPINHQAIIAILPLTPELALQSAKHRHFALVFVAAVEAEASSFPRLAAVG